MKKLFEHPLIVCILSFAIVYLAIDYPSPWFDRYPDYWEIIVSQVLVLIFGLIGFFFLLVSWSDCIKEYEQRRDEGTKESFKQALRELAEENDGESFKEALKEFTQEMKETPTKAQ